MIAELETRRRAGLPIQVVVKVEKITPSMPEYCRIVPDFCHLDVIREETSATSDEDPKKDLRKRSAKTSDSDDGSDVERVNNGELDAAVPEVKSIETVPSECYLERLESPSLVRESEILRFADIVFTENECTNEVEVFEPSKCVSIDVPNNVKNNECTVQETWNVSCDNPSNRRTNHHHPVDYASGDVRNTRAVSDTGFRSIEACTWAKLECEADNDAFSENELRAETSRPEKNAEDGGSSDGSTVKPRETHDRGHRTTRDNDNGVSVYDKLKRIASLLRGDDDTDDYEEIQTSQTTSRCVSLASDADVDTDWVSFTLSDGESSRSLCLSPSQLKSGHVPSTVAETSELIGLHRSFANRTLSPNTKSSGQPDTAAAVSVLGYAERPSRSPPPGSYTSEVIDEACRMCGTSDEPLSDAGRLVSLRKYRETRSRLLDVIQKERRLDHRSVIDRPSVMPTFIDTLSVPDNRTRELMYAEYMKKVKERENRVHNKVIRITKAGRPLSSGSLQALNDIDAEFVTRARERLEKLGVEEAVVNETKEEYYYYPKHLVDIVPEEEVCVEEVLVNGESSGLRVYGLCFSFFVFVLLTRFLQCGQV